ncbi:MAG: ferrochelatase [Bryobacteraceae bacterium]
MPVLILGRYLRVPEQFYDSILVVSFGGPEKPDDVIPFLENVLRGRNVPRNRLLEVAGHYDHFGGRSPINDQNRALVAALREELRQHGPDLPVYWGNRNWDPLLGDAVRTMRDDGRKRALAFVTSAYSGYSGCRQYREDIHRARAQVGDGAPEIDKLRVFYNHPLFIDVMAGNVEAAFAQIPPEHRANVALLYTAHSIPLAMAQTSNYEPQLLETCRLIASTIGRGRWRLVYQSRSGPPQQPWLGPDILDALREIRSQGATDAIVAPVGFISDHMEVLYDLDREARVVAGEIGLTMIRASTAGTDPRFIAMIRELIAERCGLCQPRAMGGQGPSHDVCGAGCCPAPARRI